MNDIYSNIEQIKNELSKVIIGKDRVIEKILMSMFAGGHILLDDMPGVGKTTLAVALGKVLGLKYNRIQFTPDVMPSDIVGFSMYNKELDRFSYVPGIVNDTNLLLADEINRTSSRTQAALLEAMEEGQVTVDGVSHELKNPFIVIATQNQVGSAGTQMLPHAQLDRFLVRLSIGYPDRESQIEVIRKRQTRDIYSGVMQVADIGSVLTIQKAVLEITMKESIASYIADLSIATRDNSIANPGVSPRGAIALSHMAKACAMMRGRDYVIPEDVIEVFTDVCAHRIVVGQEAKAKHKTAEGVLKEVVGKTKVPYAI